MNDKSEKSITFNYSAKDRDQGILVHTHYEIRESQDEESAFF